MYRQYEQEQQENDERSTQEKGGGIPYIEKEASYDDEKMDNMQMPYNNVIGTGIKMNIGGRPMMCYPIMDEEPTLYEQSDDSYEGMHNMGCPGMKHNMGCLGMKHNMGCPGMMYDSDMYRQPSNYYHNRPHYYPNYPMKPFFPYIWYNYYPFHMPYPPHHPYYEREDWY